jgi:hypothetical protein
MSYGWTNCAGIGKCAKVNTKAVMYIRAVYYLKSQTVKFLYTLSCYFAISMI